jgi:hypothetical protein
MMPGSHRPSTDVRVPAPARLTHPCATTNSDAGLQPLVDWHTRRLIDTKVAELQVRRVGRPAVCARTHSSCSDALQAVCPACGRWTHACWAAQRASVTVLSARHGAQDGALAAATCTPPPPPPHTHMRTHTHATHLTHHGRRG